MDEVINNDEDREPTDEEKLALQFVVIACEQIAESTGLDPMDIYINQFEGRDWHIVGTLDDFTIEIGERDEEVS